MCPVQSTASARGFSNADFSRLRKRMAREIAAKGFGDERIVAALSTVPRHLFAPEAFRAHAYDDTPLPIGFGQTISQPSVVAMATKALELEAGMRALEVGVGCGYQAAILAALGVVTLGIERLPELYRQTLIRVKKLGLESQIHLYRGDGTLGLRQAAPFERVLVSAGGPSIPEPLVAQLAEDGVLVIPVGAARLSQRLIRLRKSRGKLFKEDLGAVEFVNLVGDYGWAADS